MNIDKALASYKLMPPLVVSEFLTTLTNVVYSLVFKII